MGGRPAGLGEMIPEPWRAGKHLCNILKVTDFARWVLGMPNDE